MLRSNSKSLGNRVVSPEEEKERLQWEGFAEKEGFKIASTGTCWGPSSGGPRPPWPPLNQPMGISQSVVR